MANILLLVMLMVNRATPPDKCGEIGITYQETYEELGAFLSVPDNAYFLN